MSEAVAVNKPVEVEVQKPEDTDLTLSQILAANDREPVKVFVPEWKGNVYLKPMSADMAIKFTDGIEGPHKKQAMVRIVAEMLCDKYGKRIVPDDQIAAFKTKNLVVFQRLQWKCMEMNGWKKPSPEEKKLDAEGKPISESPFVEGLEAELKND